MPNVHKIKLRTGFTQNICGVHLLRTMMFPEMCALFDAVHENSEPREYRNAIITNNCLGKKSDSTRKLTWRHLCELYVLDKTVLLFRGLRYFWNFGKDHRMLLPMLCAYIRDPILRQSYNVIKDKDLGSIITSKEVETYLNQIWPDRFSASTLESAARHCNGTWTIAGYLKGKRNKIRTKPEISPEAVAYALFIEYLRGVRGMMMFHSELIQLLECDLETAIQLAHEASTRGMLVLKHVDDVVEVTFPNLITSKELEMINEQNT